MEWKFGIEPKGTFKTHYSQSRESLPEKNMKCNASIEPKGTFKIYCISSKGISPRKHEMDFGIGPKELPKSFQFSIEGISTRKQEMEIGIGSKVTFIFSVKGIPPSHPIPIPTIASASPLLGLVLRQTGKFCQTAHYCASRPMLASILLFCAVDVDMLSRAICFVTVGPLSVNMLSPTYKTIFFTLIAFLVQNCRFFFVHFICTGIRKEHH